MLRSRIHNSQRGMVLLLAIIALLLISAVGAAMLYMAASESGFVGSQRMAARAFYSAMGGLEEGRFRLLPANQAVGSPPLGLNYTDPLSLAGAGGVPILPCNNNPPFAVEQAGTLVPCNTSSVVAFGARPWNVLYIVNNPNANPAAPGSNPNLPAAADNDPLLTAEIPNPSVNTTGSIQPNAGTRSSVLWSWVRINLKTERASGVDLNLNGSTADDEPIFSYQGRQYRRADLLAMVGGNQVMPPPWGPIPVPTGGQICQAAVCAVPVYMLTAYANIPGPTPAGRIVRSEVGGSPSFSINASILSQPPITVSGTSTYIGYDGCDPDCPQSNPPWPGGAWAGAPSSPPLNCNFTLPLQSQSTPPNNSNVNGTSSTTYPSPPDPNACPVPSAVESGMNPNSCVRMGAPFPYNIDELVNIFRSIADTTLAPGVYTGNTLPPGALGTFPFADPYRGSGAIPRIVYVPGDFHCSGACTGAGILVVDGDFQFNASMEYYGVIIVRGDVSTLGGGSPTTGCNIYGSMLVGGTASLGTTVGGSICFRYNSCAQRDQFRNRPLGQLSFREIPD